MTGKIQDCKEIAAITSFDIKNRAISAPALFSKPFTGAELRYFASEDLEAARRWARE